MDEHLLVKLASEDALLYAKIFVWCLETMG